MHVWNHTLLQIVKRNRYVIISALLQEVKLKEIGMLLLMLISQTSIW